MYPNLPKKGMMSMPRRRKHPNLPNGFGTIRYLGEKRRNPYAVHPPTKEFNLNGTPVRPPALCYVDDWYKGFAVLTAYKAGSYYPGYEKTLDNPQKENLNGLVGQILSSYAQTGLVNAREARQPTFAEIYEMYYKEKFEEDKSKSYSNSSRALSNAAFQNCASLHDRIFGDLKYDDLQGVLDNCPLSVSSISAMKMVVKGMYDYAIKRDMAEKDYSAHLIIKKQNDVEHGVPFTENDIRLLWDHKKDYVPEMLLIMCYSGFRILEYTDMEVNLEEGYFCGGVKTKSGKNRIVPIHSGILPLVKHRLETYGGFFKGSGSNQNKTGMFRKHMDDTLRDYGILVRHTPHDTRHTFSALCERYQVAENDRKRMLGHALPDITNSVYGHRTVEDLREQIEKIPFVTNL